MGRKFLGYAISLYRNYHKVRSKGGTNVEILTNKNINKPEFVGEPRNIRWSEEQEKVLDHVRRGHSVFITGGAGTGKTFLLEHIIKMLKESYGESRVFATAPTHIAAFRLGGQTLHSFSGMGFSNDNYHDDLKKVLHDEEAWRRWRMAAVLVIDEINMVDWYFFSRLQWIAKEIRQSDEAWGGIQVIVSGDFLLLPPIPKEVLGFRFYDFAFEVRWDENFDIQIELTKNFRQSEERFIKLLENIRRGKMDSEDLHLLEQKQTASASASAELDPSMVYLYPRVRDAVDMNWEIVDSLPEEKVEYGCRKRGKGHYHIKEKRGNPKYLWKKKPSRLGLSDDLLVLCKGARVMLVETLDVSNQLVNGATGIVTGFMKNDGRCHIDELNPDKLLPIVKFDSSGVEAVIQPITKCMMHQKKVKTLSSKRQLPLTLAWGRLIHKCQGMSFDRVHVGLTSRVCEYGMVYAAISRVTTLDGLHLSGFQPSKVKAHPEALDFYERFRQHQLERDTVVVADKTKQMNLLSVSTSDWEKAIVEYRQKVSK
ncbi:DNA helicase PIF1, ATP-dependent [Corchorus olitorius]|uniref:ATP-dependent DNA helicase n=1 Tax=Corchorus olitorius TaxID=93759 RepID=A0A1R3I063_9ROSI|nr:DNA helicase PIF1, ATP-dependent [Corchorus olitorius]